MLCCSYLNKTNTRDSATSGKCFITPCFGHITVIHYNLMGIITAYSLNSVNVVFNMIIFLKYMVENNQMDPHKPFNCPLNHMVELILDHYNSMNFIQPGLGHLYHLVEVCYAIEIH